MEINQLADKVEDARRQMEQYFRVIDASAADVESAALDALHDEDEDRYDAALELSKTINAALGAIERTADLLMDIDQSLRKAAGNAARYSASRNGESAEA